MLVAIPCGFGLFSAIRASSGGFYRITGHFVVTTTSASYLVALGYCTLHHLVDRWQRLIGSG
jgi:hypothetical protein